MSTAGRIGVVVAALAALVVAFFVLAPGGDDEPSTGGAPTTRAGDPGATGVVTEPTTRPQALPAAKPTLRTIRVRSGKPVGGVRKITVEKGDRVRFQVTSADTSDEVHLHGYDVSRDLKAGGGVRFSFDANAEGIFELELEGSHTQIAQLTVEPR